MKLFENEKILAGEPGKGLVPTTHRARFDRRGGGEGQLTSMMLENIGACTLTSTTKPWLLILAAVVAAGAVVVFVQGWSTAGLVLLCMSLVVAVVYLFTRKVGIAIVSTSGTAIVVKAGGAIKEAREAIDDIEEAQRRRMTARDRTAAKAPRE